MKIVTWLFSNFQTALENRPAATRYRKHVETIKKTWIGAKLPPLYPVSRNSSATERCFNLPIDEISNQTACCKAADHCEWKRSRRFPQTHASNENNSFDAFPKNCNERQYEHGILLAPSLEAGAPGSTLLGAVLGFEGFGELDTPLILKLRHSK